MDVRVTGRPTTGMRGGGRAYVRPVGRYGPLKGLWEAVIVIVLRDLSCPFIPFLRAASQRLGQEATIDVCPSRGTGCGRRPAPGRIRRRIRDLLALSTLTAQPSRPIITSTQPTARFYTSHRERISGGGCGNS